MKYVRLQHPTEETPHFVLCLAPMQHSQLAAAFLLNGYSVVSAGFITWSAAIGISVHGRSESLGVGPADDDAQQLRMLYSATLDLLPAADRGVLTHHHHRN